MAVPQSPRSSDADSVYDWVANKARDNPAQVIGGAAVVGALVTIALLSRRPQSRVRSLEKAIERDLRFMERMLRKRRPLSTMSDRLTNASVSLASSFGSWDAERLWRLMERARELSSQVARRSTW
jgi:hypothetical protein